VFASHHNFDVDTALPGFDKDLNSGVVRNEVRVRYINRLPGRYDREVVHDPDRRRRALGRTQKSLGGYVSSFLERRKIFGSADQPTSDLKPVLRKARLKTHRCRAFDLNLDVMPMRWVLCVSSPLVSYSRATRECHTAVHDHRFPMVSMIEPSDSPQPDP